MKTEFINPAEGIAIEKEIEITSHLFDCRMEKRAVPAGCIQVCVCMEGEIAWTACGRDYTLLQGDTCLLPARYGYTVSDRAKGAAVVVTVPREILIRDCIGAFSQCHAVMELLTDSGRGTGAVPVLFHGSGRRKLEQILEDMMCEYEGKQPGYQASLRGMLLRIMVMLSRAALEEDGSRAGEAAQDEELTSELLTYLDQNFATATLRGTAAHFYYHPNTINRLLLRTTGKTFCEVIRGVRISHAKSLLTETVLPVQRIAAMCGYKNMTHFYHMFDRECGMTPYEYRNGKRQEPDGPSAVI